MEKVALNVEGKNGPLEVMTGKLINNITTLRFYLCSPL